MKFDWKKALKIALCVFGLFLAITYWHPFVALCGIVLAAMTPLIIGGIIAYIVNILMSRYEKGFFPKNKTKAISKIRRPLCMILAFLTVIVVLSAVVWLIVPQLISCIQLIMAFAAKVPNLMKEFVEKAMDQGYILQQFCQLLFSVSTYGIQIKSVKGFPE